MTYRSDLAMECIDASQPWPENGITSETINKNGISINKIKPYKNITVKANGLPDINNIAILDKSNIQSIKDIFFANKKTETSEGANIWKITK